MMLLVGDSPKFTNLLLFAETHGFGTPRSAGGWESFCFGVRWDKRHPEVLSELCFNASRHRIWMGQFRSISGEAPQRALLNRDARVTFLARAVQAQEHLRRRDIDSEQLHDFLRSPEHA